MAQDLENSIYRALSRHGSPKGQRVSVPAPVNGWNTRDPVAGMDQEFAVKLDNWFPDLGAVRTRRGTALRAKLAAGGSPNATFKPVETLVAHYSPHGKKKFAITTDGIHDFTDYDPLQTDPADPDVAPEALPAGATTTSARWRWANANGFTMLVNGVDPPITFGYTETKPEDRTHSPPTPAEYGEAWLDGGWAGVRPAGIGESGPQLLDTKKLTQIAVHKGRVWFVEAGSSDLWYSGRDAVTGALTRYPMGLLVEDAGDAKAVGSLSMDTGEGMDDQLAVVMERGQVLIFAGDDPGGGLSSWSLTGVYDLPPAVGDDPLIKLGGDLILITEDGFLPLLQFIRGGRERTDLALSDAIAPTVSQAIASGVHPSGSPLAGTPLPGWQAVLHTRSRWLLFNVPEPEGLFVQYVMNIQTKAWCRFTGMAARCWLADEEGIFFGTSDGLVLEADAVNSGDYNPGSDATRAVDAEARSAYSYMGSPYDKQFHCIRPHFTFEQGQTSIDLGVATDFGRFTPINVLRVRLASNVSEWNVSEWDTFEWAGGPERSEKWFDLYGADGTAAAMEFDVTTNGAPITWESTDFLFERLANRGGTP